MVLYAGANPKQVEQKNDVLSTDFLQVKLSIPENRGISYIPLKPAESFASIPYEELVRRLRSGENSFLDGKILIIGQSNGPDRHTLANGQEVDGMVTHALGVNTLLKAALLGETLSQNFNRIIAGTLSLLFLSWMLKTRKVHPILIGLAGLGTAFWIVPWITRVTIGLTEPWFLASAMGLSSLICLASTSLLSDRIKLRPAGSFHTCVAMFLDIKSSTEILQRVGAQRFQQLHSKLNQAWTQIVEKHHGEIERTTGDGFFATFKELNRILEEGELEGFVAELILASISAFDIEGVQFSGSSPVSIGIEAGSVTGGYIREFGGGNWSSSGMPIHIAQRAQSASRDLGYDVIIGPGLGNLLKGQAHMIDLGEHALKGLHKPIYVFALSSEKLVNKLLKYEIGVKL
jgi:class 3 adenylate cyclase